jgi:hypothetical protein
MFFLSLSYHTTKRETVTNWQDDMGGSSMHQPPPHERSELRVGQAVGV